MKNFISIPTNNIFEERANIFLQSQNSQRLKEKYRPKAFEEIYQPIYTISYLASYACNIISIFTASTFVFTYFNAMFTGLPMPYLWAIVLTGFSLILIEILQRLLTPHFFKNILQYGFKSTSFILVAFILSLSSISIYFSYNGGFDVVETIKEKPQYIEPTLKNIGEVRNEFMPLIEGAAIDAKDYKKAKEWLGRLSDKDAKVYKELLERKARLQTQMLAKIEAIEAQNKQVIESSKEAHQKALDAYENSLINEGGGLATFTIIAQVVFFASIFFMEYFDYKTALQYALIPGFSTSPIGKHYQVNSNGNTFENSYEIGFKVNKSKHLKKVSKQFEEGEPATINEKHTINHKGKRYTLRDVNNFISIYERRMKDALESGKEKVVDSRKETLLYWQGRKQELLKKLD